MSRDDFSSDTKLRLAKRAAFRCSFPGCRRHTVGPSNDEPSAVACVGIAAHIAAAAPGGRRFDPLMTPQQRSGIENGVWLCATHATLVDRDAVRYTVVVLRQMKADHEAFIQRCVDGVPESPQEDPLAQRIGSAAQSILRAMDEFWEVRLFAQVLRDEIAKHADIARDAHYGVYLHRRRVDKDEFVAIARQAMRQANGYCEAATRLFDAPLRQAIGPPGVAGDPQAICYVALRMSEIYKSVLEWGLSWRGIECDWSESHGFIALMPEFIHSIASAIERLPADIEAQVGAARNYHGETPVTFRVTLLLEIPDDIQRRVRRELNRMTGESPATGRSRGRLRWLLLMFVILVCMARVCGT